MADGQFGHVFCFAFSPHPVIPPLNYAILKYGPVHTSYNYKRSVTPTTVLILICLICTSVWLKLDDQSPEVKRNRSRFYVMAVDYVGPSRPRLIIAVQVRVARFPTTAV